jgi:hypothetical protein
MDCFAALAMFLLAHAANKNSSRWLTCGYKALDTVDDQNRIAEQRGITSAANIVGGRTCRSALQHIADAGWNDEFADRRRPQRHRNFQAEKIAASHATG